MKLGVLVALLGVALAEDWRWPAASERIDTKLHFIDHDSTDKRHERGSGEVPFKEAVETEGFYNRPRGAGRYPVHVEEPRAQQHRPRTDRNNNYESDGTLDSLQYCKCVSTPECAPHQDSQRACGAGKFLCCYNKPFAGQGQQQTHEFFNEIDDERPMLLPGRESIARPFPPPPGAAPGVLAGPGGPTGHIGPAPAAYATQPPVLVGPNGPSGIIGPKKGQGLLLNPQIPIDPIHPEESAQRGVLVGPGGPTGFIGPQGGYSRRQVLVGPGGPTGIIGPRRQFGGFYDNGYGRGMGRGVLVGPGGPTGTIGPGRGLLVGPGGPTGQIGPQGYFG